MYTYSGTRPGRYPRKEKQVQDRFKEIVDSLASPGDEGEDKVTALRQAIEEHVTPGMTLHIAGEPSAALRQLLRLFWKRDARFTVVSGSLSRPYGTGLVRFGLASKVITSAQENPYGPSTCPDGLASVSCFGRTVKVENWSLYSVEQRLMAGAMGLAFMPTLSIAGSDMALENADSFRVISDPFDTGRQQAVVKALVPDISFVHGCVADRYGNTILPLPCANLLWGPRASRNGVIVTVEKVVSTDFIRHHAALVKLPGYLVRAVCEVPLGAHPAGMVNQYVEAINGYEADWEFVASHDRVAPDRAALEEWVSEWVLGCPSQDEYLTKLGRDRIRHLEQAARPDAWRENLAVAARAVEKGSRYTADEMMLIAAAREIKDRVPRSGYRTILSGAGTAGFAAWLAYHWLRREGYGIDLLWGLGRAGWLPLPGQTNPVGVFDSLSSKMLTDTAEIYGVMVGGQGARCMSVLGVLQIDRFGNINNSRVGWRSLGSGGSGDAINASETLVIVKHSPERVVDRVGYVTCRGDRVKTLVTSLGVFRKIDGEEEFTLTACMPDSRSTTPEKRIREIVEACPWDLKTAAEVEEVPPPTPEELLWLRLLDPAGALTGP